MSTKPKPILTQDDAKERVAVLMQQNTAARAELEAHFGAERWQKLRAQSVNSGIADEHLTSLCGKMRRTRREWHPDNDRAALIAAAHGLLVTLGSVPSEADVAALQDALKSGSNASPSSIEQPASRI